MSTKGLVATVFAASTPALVFGYYLAIICSTAYAPEEVTRSPWEYLPETRVAWMYYIELGAIIYGGLGLVNFTKYFGPLASIAIADASFILLVPLLVVYMGNLPHHDMKELFVGLLSIGAAGGASVVFLTIYISEISPSKIRGALVSTIFLQIAVGQILYHLLKLLSSSSHLHLEEVETWHWRLAIVLPIIHLAFLIGGALPESPRWLYRKGHSEKAKEALILLRSSNEVSSEVKFMELSLMEEAEEDKGQREKEKQLESRNCYPFSTPWYMVPSRRIVAGYGLFVAQQFVGLNMIMHYSYTIFHLTTNRYSRKTEIGNSETIINTTSALEIPLIMSTLVLVGTLICTTLVDRFGRRRLLLISISGIISSLGLLSCLFHIGINCAGGLKLLFSNTGVVDDNRLFWYNIDEEMASSMGLLALAALAVYMISYSLGVGTVPWIINSEIYPMKYRFVCVIMGNVVYWMAKLLVEVFFLDKLGKFFSVADMLFLLFSFSWVVGFFIYFYIPETKGLQLDNVDKVLLLQEKHMKYNASKQGQESSEELKVLL
ncbi:hypothetical protein MKW98_010070 [Papaver atlanticum]|uniref:Major facilitator superfamily (MFS) profile domain-containing protein n=1 Tax=Papaver atlanticum TaxID=357466 RepID=A0AAD4RXE9_9MAGN|nr:hypothetical protein MKW98_010070 [Papaver atlanticum]